MERVSIGPLLGMLRISLGGIKHFSGKKGHRYIVILKVPYTFTKTNNPEVKTIGPLLDMLCISLPGDKTFSRKKKHNKLDRFLKSNIPFLTKNSINRKSLNWTPTGYATHLPSGDKYHTFHSNVAPNDILQ